MSFTGPNHARALFWGLFSTWLYASSVVWVCAAISKAIDPISLALGSISLGMLVYGAAVIHRGFVMNALPFGATTFDLFAGASRGTEMAIQISGSLIILASSVVVLWVVYHSYRDHITPGRSLPVAFTLGLPILLYEASRHLFGIDIYDTFVSVIFGVAGR